MERTWRKLAMAEGHSVHVDLDQVVMLAGAGADTRAVLVTGTELLLAGPIREVAESLGEFRLRGINHYRINPDHVVAIEATGVKSCRLHLSTGAMVDAEDIAADDMTRAIERQARHPWETIRMAPARS